MKLNKVKLINYIGIYNGMGIHEIDIDFSKCIHSITVIKGDNGSGKSSLFKTIHPFSDTQNSLILNLKAAKYISYILDDNSILEISYEYPVDKNGNRSSTKCFVFYNGKDMNPNHNVNDGKEIICNLLDIDINFLTLAQLSSDDRGLADKKPSERKKFINNKISELEAFNNIYKKISRKSTDLNNLIKSINTKIQSIGDIQSIASNIKLMTNQLSDLDEQKTLLLIDISKIQSKLEEISSNSQFNPEEYGQLKTRIFTLKSKLSKYNIDESIKETDEYNTEKEYIKASSNLENTKNIYNKRLSEASSIRDKIESLELKLSSMGDLKLIDSYMNRIGNIKKKQEEFKQLCLKNGFINYNHISETEYKYILESLESFHQSIYDFQNSYDYHIIEKTIPIFINKINGVVYQRETSIEELDSMKENLTEIKRLIDQQNFFKEQSKNFSMIPEDCPHKNDCPFVKSITSAHDSILSSNDYDKLIKESDRLNEDINTYKSTMHQEDQIEKCESQIDYLFGIDSQIMKPSLQEIMNKFKIKFISSKEEFDYVLPAILLSHDHTDWYQIDFQYYNSIENAFIESKSYDKEIERLEKECDSLRSNKELSEYINKELNELKDQYFICKSDCDKFNNQVKESENYCIILQNKLHMIKTQLNLKKTRDQEQEEFDRLYQLNETYKSQMEEYDVLDKEFTDKKKILDDLISNQIPALEKNINMSKYKIVLYNDYAKEYKEYKESYHKIETIKRYCSPTTGIQTIYMNMYMNNILGISNQILSSFFGGDFVLQPFIINEKEFRMPVLGSGILNDDISSMSTSQICMISMIISFALLHKSSSIYNIVKLDEIDGGLDTNNRLAFFNALNDLMINMGFRQCLMISHNTELNMNNMDVIILKNSDPSLNIEGNVIYQYE